MTMAMRSKGKYTKKMMARWYEDMLLIRRFEEKCAQMYGQQKIRGFCHLYSGQEACIAGAVSALKVGDSYITAYRDHGMPLALGSSPNRVMAELFGKGTGLSGGNGGSMHLFDKARKFFGGHGIVGGQIPLGVGIAFAEKYKKTGYLCIVYMGDGAVRQGAFHESLNLAMTYKLPVIFAVENNGYAMGTSVERSSNVRDLYTLGEAYDMPSYPVDGLSVFAVHEAVSKAAVSARKGTPTFLELRTYRYRGHSMSDPAKYRTKEEVARYKQKDCIETLQKTMLQEKTLQQGELDAIGQRVKQKVTEAVAYAEEDFYPSPDTVTQHVYVEADYPFTTD